MTMLNDDELYHFGVKGMKWGVRHYQNKDGSLTKDGQRRAQKDAKSLSKAMSKHLDSTQRFSKKYKKNILGRQAR